MRVIGHIRTAFLCLILGVVAASGQTMQVYEIDGHDLLIHVNPALHQRYGLGYPVTYVVQFPSDRTGLHAYVRYDTTSAWTALQTKLPTDYFNGIDAVRFDYTTSTAYVSATLSESSDDLNIHITDGTGEPVSLSYQGVAHYYDNRTAAVLVGIDDWKDYTDTQFLRLNAILRSYNLAFTAAVLTGDCTDSTYAHIQAELNAGMFEAASHTRNHPRWPYDNLEDEIDGSRTDLLNNLIFPRQFRKGDTEYIYSFVVPFGETSAEIETVVTHSGYLNSRVVGHQSGLYADWNSNTGRFLWDGTTKEMGPPWGSTDAAELNAAFDSRMAQHRIYHLLIHPYALEAAGDWDQPYIPEHLAHISNRTDVWYTTFGHLYVYRLLGDSTVGETVWPVTAPFVTINPLSHNVVEGSTVTFTCGATGSTPLSYQWQKNGTNIAGATVSSYVLTTATMADSGKTFRCIVRNAQGADTSASAILTVVSAGSGSGIVSDDFNAQALNTSLWQFVNPLHDVSLAMTGGGTQDARLALTIPAGTAHDIWTAGVHAPRIMQPSVNSDLEIEAKFDATESAPLQTQGLLVEQDSLNFVRFDIVRDSPQLALFAATFSDGVPTEQLDMGVTLTAPYYLRVRRVGDQWTCLYSSDGTTWIEAITFTHVLTVRQVGVWAGNAGSPAPAFTGLIDYFFNTLSPVIGEDGPDLRVRPVVTSDPATVTVLQGQPASFTTAASGTAPLSYQWQKNGTDISGATGNGIQHCSRFPVRQRIDVPMHREQHRRKGHECGCDPERQPSLHSGDRPGAARHNSVCCPISSIQRGGDRDAALHVSLAEEWDYYFWRHRFGLRHHQRTPGRQRSNVPVYRIEYRRHRYQQERGSDSAPSCYCIDHP